MILGMAVAVMVMNIEPRNIDSIVPTRAAITCRLGNELWNMAVGSMFSTGLTGGAVVLISLQS